MTTEISVTTVISFILTLMVFSYILGDVPVLRFLYRVAIYIFVGMTAAFTTIVTFQGVLLPYLQDIQDPSTAWTLLGNTGDIIIFFTAILFGVLLLLKPIARLSWLTNSVIAVVIVVGSAIAVVGAMTGTLFPIARNTTTLTLTRDGFTILNTVIMFIGMITSLLYFQFQARRTEDGTIERGAINKRLSAIGKIFIVVTLGAVYATAILTSLTIFSERIGFLLRFGG